MPIFLDLDYYEIFSKKRRLINSLQINEGYIGSFTQSTNFYIGVDVEKLEESPEKLANDPGFSHYIELPGLEGFEPEAGDLLSVCGTTQDSQILYHEKNDPTEKDRASTTGFHKINGGRDARSTDLSIPNGILISFSSDFSHVSLAKSPNFFLDMEDPLEKVCRLPLETLRVDPKNLLAQDEPPPLLRHFTKIEAVEEAAGSLGIDGIIWVWPFMEDLRFGDLRLFPMDRSSTRGVLGMDGCHIDADTDRLNGLEPFEPKGPEKATHKDYFVKMSKDQIWNDTSDPNKRTYNKLKIGLSPFLPPTFATVKNGTFYPSDAKGGRESDYLIDTEPPDQMVTCPTLYDYGSKVDFALVSDLHYPNRGSSMTPAKNFTLPLTISHHPDMITWAHGSPMPIFDPKKLLKAGIEASSIPAKMAPLILDVFSFAKLCCESHVEKFTAIDPDEGSTRCVRNRGEKIYQGGTNQLSLQSLKLVFVKNGLGPYRTNDAQSHLTGPVRDIYDESVNEGRNEEAFLLQRIQPEEMSDVPGITGLIYIMTYLDGVWDSMVDPTGAWLKHFRDHVTNGTFLELVAQIGRMGGSHETKVDVIKESIADVMTNMLNTRSGDSPELDDRLRLPHLRDYQTSITFAFLYVLYSVSLCFVSLHQYSYLCACAHINHLIDTLTNWRVALGNYATVGMNDDTKLELTDPYDEGSAQDPEILFAYWLRICRLEVLAQPPAIPSLPNPTETGPVSSSDLIKELTAILNHVIHKLTRLRDLLVTAIWGADGSRFGAVSCQILRNEGVVMEISVASDVGEEAVQRTIEQIYARMSGGNFIGSAFIPPHPKLNILTDVIWKTMRTYQDATGDELSENRTSKYYRSERGRTPSGVPSADVTEDTSHNYVIFLQRNSSTEEASVDILAWEIACLLKHKFCASCYVVRSTNANNADEVNYIVEAIKDVIRCQSCTIILVGSASFFQSSRSSELFYNFLENNFGLILDYHLQPSEILGDPPLCDIVWDIITRTNVSYKCLGNYSGWNEAMAKSTHSTHVPVRKSVYIVSHVVADDKDLVGSLEGISWHATLLTRIYQNLPFQEGSSPGPVPRVGRSFADILVNPYTGIVRLKLGLLLGMGSIGGFVTTLIPLLSKYRFLYVIMEYTPVPEYGLKGDVPLSMARLNVAATIAKNSLVDRLNLLFTECAPHGDDMCDKIKDVTKTFIKILLSVDPLDTAFWVKEIEDTHQNDDPKPGGNGEKLSGNQPSDPLTDQANCASSPAGECHETNYDGSGTVPGENGEIPQCDQRPMLVFNYAPDVDEIFFLSLPPTNSLLVQTLLSHMSAKDICTTNFFTWFGLDLPDPGNTIPSHLYEVLHPLAHFSKPLLLLYLCLNHVSSIYALNSTTQSSSTIYNLLDSTTRTDSTDKSGQNLSTLQDEAMPEDLCPKFSFSFNDPGNDRQDIWSAEDY